MSRNDSMGAHETYDLHQHTHCTVIYMGKTKISMDTFSTSCRSSPNSKSDLGKEARITYNKHGTDIISWGDQVFEKDNKDCIHVDNFSDGLYSVFKKSKENRDEDDQLLMKAISDYIPLAVRDSIKRCKIKIENDDVLHYAFVTPSEWEEEVNEELIRPIFIQSGLISQNDNKDKLLFFTDIESICYGLKDKDFEKYFFSRGQNTILCRLVPIEMDMVSAKLDLISTINPLFDFPESRLFPKVIRSGSFSISIKDIKDSIKAFLQTNLSLDDQDQSMDMMVEHIYNKELPDMDPCATRETFISYDDDDHVEYDIYDDDNFFTYDDDEYDDDDNREEVNEGSDGSDGYNRNGNASNEEGNAYYEEEYEPWITERFEWKLTEIQRAILISVEPFDIYSSIINTLFGTIKNTISQSFMKEYSLLITEDQYSSAYKLDSSLLKWIKYMLEYNRRSLDYIVTISKSDLSTEISQEKILFGAIEGVFETIQNADMYCRPRITPAENTDLSSSIFLKSGPNAILSMNISLKSTQLSYSIVDNNGLVDRIFGYEHFNKNICIPSLESFYNDPDKVSSIAINQFASFAKNYLADGSSLYQYFTGKSGIVPMVKTELTKQQYGLHKIYEEVLLGEFRKCIGVERWMNYPNKGKYTTLMKNELTMTLVLIYIAYINKVISNGLPPRKGTQIGFAVTIEKMLLDNVIGSKDNLKSLIYASGLLENDNESKKLRIMIQGDELLPIIQQSLDLKFPLKSYFVLSQLYEDYVRLTLNQIVTSPHLEEQEAVILQDKIIPINDIYDSLSLNMWDNILEDSSLIQLCDFHKEDKKIEIFSFKSKKCFTKSFKRYLHNNIFKESPNWRKTDTISIELGAFCSCIVHLKIKDIIDISVKPVLRDITSTVLASLIDKRQFGKYTNIEHVFNFIYFNHSQTFQATLVKLLEDIFDDFIQQQNIDVDYSIMAELPNEHLKPVLRKRPLSYKGFLNGTLHQVFGSNYTFSFSQMSEYFTLKSRKEYKNEIVIDEDISFPLMKKGDIISGLRLNKVFYLNLRKQLFGHFFIDYYTFKKCNGLSCASIPSLKDSGIERIGSSCVDLKNIDPKVGADLKVMISIVSSYYSSSIRLSAKLVGAETEKRYFMELGEPMTLCRF